MTPIDLSQLPAPKIIESLDFESLLTERKDRLIALTPERDRAELAAVLSLESEPLTKFLEESAYRELLLRQTHNERAQALMLAYAAGSELDHIGVSYYMTERLLITPADPDARPPVEAVYESDAEYRRRLLLAHDAFSTAGSRRAYQYYALSGSPRVKDADAERPLPGVVRVYLLARDGSGAADQALVEQIDGTLNAETVRPLTDTVNVTTAEIIEYSVAATLILQDGPDGDVVLAEARRRAREYVESRHALGEQIVIGAIEARLYAPGVERVLMHSPSADIPARRGRAPYCTGIEVVIND